VNVLSKVGAFVDENGGGWAMDDVMMPPREICQEEVLFCMAVWPFGNITDTQLRLYFAVAVRLLMQTNSNQL
jgi:hypothetical protein